MDDSVDGASSFLVVVCLRSVGGGGASGSASSSNTSSMLTLLLGLTGAAGLTNGALVGVMAGNPFARRSATK